jgi:hypothetical protein
MGAVGGFSGVIVGAGDDDAVPTSAGSGVGCTVWVAATIRVAAVCGSEVGVVAGVGEGAGEGEGFGDGRRAGGAVTRPSKA